VFRRAAKNDTVTGWVGFTPDLRFGVAAAVGQSCGTVVHHSGRIVIVHRDRLKAVPLRAPLSAADFNALGSPQRNQSAAAESPRSAQ
jgi:hypothetical protein